MEIKKGLTLYETIETEEETINIYIDLNKYLKNGFLEEDIFFQEIIKKEAKVWSYQI